MLPPKDKRSASSGSDRCQQRQEQTRSMGITFEQKWNGQVLDAPYEQKQQRTYPDTFGNQSYLPREDQTIAHHHAGPCRTWLRSFSQRYRIKYSHLGSSLRRRERAIERKCSGIAHVAMRIMLSSEKQRFDWIRSVISQFDESQDDHFAYLPGRILHGAQQYIERRVLSPASQRVDGSGTNKAMLVVQCLQQQITRRQLIRASQCMHSGGADLPLWMLKGDHMFLFRYASRKIAFALLQTVHHVGKKRGRRLFR